MKFSDYIKNENNNSNSNNIGSDNIESFYNKYKDLSDNELLNEFVKQSHNLKQKGGLSDDKISNIKSTIFPYLNEEQKLKFEQLMKMVCNVK